MFSQCTDTIGELELIFSAFKYLNFGKEFTSHPPINIFPPLTVAWKQSRQTGLQKADVRLKASVIQM